MTRTSTILLEGLKDQSDQNAWLEFDHRYRSLLLAVGRRLGLSADDTEDAAQETLAAFIVEYRAGRYRRDTGRLRDWVAGIMTHKVRDVQRRRQRQRALGQQPDRSDALELIEDTSVVDSVQQEWSGAVLRECLEKIRREVSPQMFESFELYALHQLPAVQVGQRLGITPEVVYQNKRRMLLRIRELMPQVEESW